MTITDPNYLKAINLRHQAERTGDPELFERAAIAFEEIGGEVAAKRLREKAKLYKYTCLGCERSCCPNYRAPVPDINGST
jgi:hypothetical protein